MIKKLRKKLIFVLMGVVCVFLIGILTSLFISSKTDYERRSMANFRDFPRHAVTSPTAEVDAEPLPTIDANKPGDPDFSGTPTAFARVSADGSIEIAQNQIYYVTDDELTSIVEGLQASDQTNGTTDQYELRYRRYTNENTGVTVYFFSDTYVERSSLNAQLLYSCIIGLGAIGLFFVVALLLSRWMLRPVEQAWEKQRQFVADASHELKTPLTVVLSNADMLIASHAVTDERNARRLDNIKAESLRMKGLVENLLTLARSDSGSEQLNREPVNFSYVVTCSALTLEPAIYDLGHTIDTQLEDNLTVLGDGAKLRQLCDILLDNAGKYSREGSAIDVRLCAVGKREIQLTVASLGDPLSPAECTSIFERFYRSDKSRGAEKGYGLGLAIAQTIVKQHGGKLWAQSDGIDKNEFIVKLPSTGDEGNEGDVGRRLF